MLFMIAIPIMLQNALTNVVGLLDNIMVGQTGTNSMSGVSIANNLMFVFIIVCFGAVSGAGIFSAQYYGKRDYEGMAAAFRLKIYICSIFTLVAVAIFIFFGRDLVRLYLHDSNDGIGDTQITLKAAMDYLNIMLIGLPFLGISMCYSSTLRESGKTLPPMVAGIAAVLVDLVFNYLLIFGHLGFPKWGVKGAAVATVLSRLVECLINMIYTHAASEKCAYIKYAYKSFKVPGSLLRSIIIKGLPLMVNEALWVLSITIATQSYSVRGLSAVAALNIDSSIANVFNIFFLAMGSAVSIIIGPMLGADKIEEAKDTARKLIAFTFVSCLVTASLMALCSGIFPALYKVEPEVKTLATRLIVINALFVPFQGVCHSGYFALRSGGKTWLTFLFDSGISWIAYVPLAYFFARFSDLSILGVYAAASCADILKCFIALLFLNKVNWAQNIVNEER